MGLIDHKLRDLRAEWMGKWREKYGRGQALADWESSPAIRLEWYLKRAESDLALARKLLLDGDHEGMAWAIDSLIGGCGPNLCGAADAYVEEHGAKGQGNGT